MLDVPVNDRAITYSLQGGETRLSADWKIKAAADLTVRRTRGVTSALLVAGTDYALIGVGNDRGVTIELAEPAEKGDIFRLAGDETVVFVPSWVIARHRGDWTIGEAYEAGDGVYLLGSSYLAKADHAAELGNVPGSAGGAAVWQLVAAKGADGADGAGGAGGGGNVDGGAADTNFGGTSPIDGGTA